MIKNTTHSSIGCNGMATNDDYHGLEMYKNHAKDSTTEGYMQPDPTTMECDHHRMWPNQSLQSQGNALINYQLPNDPVKAGRRWGQRHPQGANLGSNGILNFLSKLKQWLPPAHPKQTNKQKFKVRQPQRAARSKRPNTPSDGSKNNGIHTTKQEEYPSRQPTTDTANKSPAGD